jgi:cobalt-zinc-cadmium efflux system membrane fusion protein
MSTTVTNGRAVRERTPPLRRVARTFSTAFVLALLGGVAYWGHRTGWTFSQIAPISEPSAVGEAASPRPLVRRSSDASPRAREVARIEFGSAEAVDRAGIDVTPVWASALTEEVAAAGEVRFDPARVARVSARADGVARRVLKAVGDPVRAGEVLAVVESAEVGRAKAELQRALVQARLRGQVRDDLAGAKAATSPAAMREAEAAATEAGVRVLTAAQALANLGLPVVADEFRGLTPTEVAKKLRGLGSESEAADAAGANLLPIRSPFAGVVLSTDVVAGEVVESGKTAFIVVDAARVWVTLHVSQAEVRRVEVGQKAAFRPDGGGAERTAVVVWVGSEANETTRTVPVRAEADNADGALRASTLGRGQIVIRHEPKALVVPHRAVRQLGNTPVVFVRNPDYHKPGGPKAFVARAVRVGGSDALNTEILAGVSSGEIVVTKGSEVLLQEISRAEASR